MRYRNSKKTTISKSKKQTTNCYVPRPNLLAEAHTYLTKLGIHWMSATTMVGKYSLDEIRSAVLTMKNHNVNVHEREEFMFKILAKQREDE